MKERKKKLKEKMDLGNEYLYQVQMDLGNEYLYQVQMEIFNNTMDIFHFSKKRSNPF